jgi:hypothetical protein
MDEEEGDQTRNNETERSTWLGDYMEAWNNLTDSVEHRRLQNAVIEHMNT